MIANQNMVFCAENRHTGSCGMPPNVTNLDTDKYYGYFENEYGEQWVLVYDPKERRGILRGGDAGWENEYEVEDGAVHVILSPAEEAWVQACLKAAAAK